jgi:hypothetical protein
MTKGVDHNPTPNDETGEEEEKDNEKQQNKAGKAAPLYGRTKRRR